MGCAARAPGRRRQITRRAVRQPLRLAIALQVYRDRDPGELLKLTVAQARGRLWERLLESSADGYPGATARQVRGWLAWLAAGMRRANRQRFMLHELYLLDPQSPRAFRVFRVLLGLATGLLYGLVAGLADGLASALVVGPFVGLVVWLRASPRPSVRTQVHWRARLHHATRPRKLATDLIAALAAGLFIGMIAGLITGDWLLSGLFWALAGLLIGSGSFAVDLAARVGTKVIIEDPPHRFAHAGPDAVLLASRSSGLLSGLLIGLAVPLASALVFGLVGALVGGLAGDLVGGLGIGLFIGLVYGLVIGLVGGLVGGLAFGLDAWLYHRWLRWRLAARGALPARLPAFLQWCTQDERGWLRISDAYEFRHRELLEHLAPTPPPD